MRRHSIIFLLMIAAAAHSGEPPANWAFRPRTRPEIPLVAPAPIDAFLLQQLKAKGLTFAPREERARLLRRVTYDLTGLPPTLAELAAFLSDEAPTAFAKVVDRLLASSAYGERQAVPWLDVVRFAESDGFKADDPRKHAWQYRDYVIRSFNADKPFDRFIREQLAGDELFPNDPDAVIATGFLRHYPDEYNGINLDQRRLDILTDITDTTGQAFLGITLGCAKCHDHKFDPIKQEDYYRTQAFFAGWQETDRSLMQPAEQQEYERRRKEWEAATAEIRQEILELEKPLRDKYARERRGRFPEEYAKLLDVPEERRTPLEQQYVTMVVRQMYMKEDGMFNGMKAPEKERYAALTKKLKEAGPKPQPATVAMAFTEVGREAPPTHLLKRGLPTRKGDEVRPGFLSACDNRFAEITPSQTATSGRRTALAHWIADPKNPLTARVIVNRIWQQHFGRGLVATSGDFGAQGERPTHPELLDWLAEEFIARGWGLKQLHRMIVLSTAYQQSTAFNPAAAKVDPDNKLLWRMNRRRLDGEALRDAVLSVAGVLNPKAGGPSVFPPLPAELTAKVAAWPVSSDLAEHNRRSVYVFVKRNLRYPLFAAFDVPDRSEACSRRFETVTAPQALMLLNEKLYAALAREFAARVTREAGSDSAISIEHAYQIALARKPSEEERSAAREFLSAQSAKAGGSTEAMADFCHALLNLNEFLYID